MYICRSVLRTTHLLKSCSIRCFLMLTHLASMSRSLLHSSSQRKVSLMRTNGLSLFISPLEIINLSFTHVTFVWKIILVRPCYTCLELNLTTVITLGIHHEIVSKHLNESRVDIISDMCHWLLNRLAKSIDSSDQYLGH